MAGVQFWKPCNGKMLDIFGNAKDHSENAINDGALK